jgi:sugar phosphate isomerase/epimerase
VAEVRQLAADRGVRISSVTGYGLFPDVQLTHQERVIETAVALGCTLVMVNVYYDDHGAFTEALAQLADRAERHGVRLGVEFMPFSGLRTLSDTERAIERVDRRNVGYVIDALHLMRSGGTPGDVRRLDPERIFLGQLCDAKRKAVPPSDDELRAEARAHREYPGEGDAPLYDLLSALPDNLEIEIEVPRSDFEAMSFAERAREIGNRFRRYMAEYDNRLARR